MTTGVPSSDSYSYYDDNRVQYYLDYLCLCYIAQRQAHGGRERHGWHLAKARQTGIGDETDGRWAVRVSYESQMGNGTRKKKCFWAENELAYKKDECGDDGWVDADTDDVVKRKGKRSTQTRKKSIEKREKNNARK